MTQIVDGPNIKQAQWRSTQLNKHVACASPLISNIAKVKYNGIV